MSSPKPSTSKDVCTDVIEINEEQCNESQNVDSAINSKLEHLADAEEYLEKKDVKLLEYEKQIFIDILHADGLVVCARGISYDRVVINLLGAYLDPGNLILIINSKDYEEKYYTNALNSKFVHESSSNTVERERVYLEGGVQFISTRILVVDLLKKRIPIELITGIIVLRAHQVVESCQEAFALRLYRQNNKTGFIKAFSSSVESFTFGYGHVERVMRNLFLTELLIWPRFHAITQQSLKPYEPQIVEFHIPMTQKMTLLQTHILELMNLMVQDLKRINRFVEMGEVTAENFISKRFHKFIQAQLDSVWHQLSSSTKQLIMDLKVVRSLMMSLVYGDAVSSYALTSKYRSTNYAMNNSGWTLHAAADQMFNVSQQRVFNKDGEFDAEPCPKWKSLVEILRVEIPNDIQSALKKNPKLAKEKIKILILCQDGRTCHQLSEVLQQGPERHMFFNALKHSVNISKISERFKDFSKTASGIKVVHHYETQPTAESVPNVSVKTSQMAPKENEKPALFLRDRMKAKLKEQEPHEELDLNVDDPDGELSSLGIDADDEPCFRDSYMLTMSQKLNVSLDTLDGNMFDVSQFGEFEPCPELDKLNMTQIVQQFNRPIVCIQSFKSGDDERLSLERTLQEMDPKYIVMYHCNVTAIRQIEIHEAKQCRPPVDRCRVFFLMHARTVEEQAYLTSLRREKESFELLIKTKSTMVIPEYQDGKSNESILLPIPEEFRDTRKAGGRILQQKDVPRVIVDMREFRSDLPCLIHKRGIEIIPLTITIGDYILTPYICVERKSISDLIGSLNSGRLYNQCVQMMRNYAKPILLIEFDQNKPFHLQGNYVIASESTPNADVVQKLQMITMTFPKLRLVWSPSPYATAQLFEELKQGKLEPDAKRAAAIGSDDSSQDADTALRFNPNIHDFMMRLPGINPKNIGKVMRAGKSLKEILKKNEAELTELLGSSADAKMLWEIMHNAHKQVPLETQKFVGSKWNSGRRGGRK